MMFSTAVRLTLVDLLNNTASLIFRHLQRCLECLVLEQTGAEMEGWEEYKVLRVFWHTAADRDNSYDMFSVCYCDIQIKIQGYTNNIERRRLKLGLRETETVSPITNICEQWMRREYNEQFIFFSCLHPSVEWHCQKMSHKLAFLLTSLLLFSCYFFNFPNWHFGEIIQLLTCRLKQKTLFSTILLTTWLIFTLFISKV